jgi:O-antigen ligase
MSQLSDAAGMKGVVASSNVSTREDAWILGINLAAQLPLTGVGVGALAPFYATWTNTPPGGFLLGFAHNTYVEAFYGTGLVGGGVFMVIVAGVVRRSWRAERRFTASAPGSGIATVLPAAATVTLVASAFTSQLLFAPIWLAVALAVLAGGETPGLSPDAVDRRRDIGAIGR